MKASNKVRILIVNDDQAELSSLADDISTKESETLEVLTYGPNQAGSKNYIGISLIDNLKNKSNTLIKSTDFDVMFVDYAMPGMTGVELLTYINKELPDLKIPIVLMTKYDDQMIKEVVKAVEMGARGYIFTIGEMFTKEVVIAAQRVFKEIQREQWTEALMEISANISSVSGEQELCELVIRVLMKVTNLISIFITW